MGEKTPATHTWPHSDRETIRRAGDYGNLKNVHPISHPKLESWIFRPNHPIFKCWQLIHELFKTSVEKHCGSYDNVSQWRHFRQPTAGLQFWPSPYTVMTILNTRSCKASSLQEPPSVSMPCGLPAAIALPPHHMLLHLSHLSSQGGDLPPLKKGYDCLQEPCSGCAQMNCIMLHGELPVHSSQAIIIGNQLNQLKVGKGN